MTMEEFKQLSRLEQIKEIRRALTHVREIFEDIHCKALEDKRKQEESE